MPSIIVIESQNNLIFTSHKLKLHTYQQIHNDNGHHDHENDKQNYADLSWKNLKTNKSTIYSDVVASAISEEKKF